MPFADWKEWATRHPEWIHENVENAFKKFIEQKWKDALNKALTEPGSWEAGGSKTERTPAERVTGLAWKAKGYSDSTLSQPRNCRCNC